MILVAAGEQGLYGSMDSGLEWNRLDGKQSGLPEGEQWVVGFDPDGVPYVGGPGGLYRATSSQTPWNWERLRTESVKYLDFGPENYLYLVTGQGRAADAICYHNDTVLSGIDLNNVWGTITAIVAHPEEAGNFYVGSLFQVYQVACDGASQAIGPAPGQWGISDMVWLPTPDGYSLFQANAAGLYQLVNK
jgi:hypothetical protein